MTDYIRREDALNASKIVYIEYLEIDDDQYIEGEADYFPVVFKKDIEKIPAADVVEQKHGQWLITDRYHDFMDGTELTILKCSECGDEFSLDGERPAKKYCSNCGARMDGD